MELALAILILSIFVVLGLTIWAFVDAIQRPAEQFPRWTKAGTSDKTVWIVGMVVAWVIGLGWVVAIVYLFVVRKKMGPIVWNQAGPPPAAPPP